MTQKELIEQVKKRLTEIIRTLDDLSPNGITIVWAQEALALLDQAEQGPTGNGWDDVAEIGMMLKQQIKVKLEEAVLETVDYPYWKPIREALALLDQYQDESQAQKELQKRPNFTKSGHDVPGVTVSEVQAEPPAEILVETEEDADMLVDAVEAMLEGAFIKPQAGEFTAISRIEISSDREYLKEPTHYQCATGLRNTANRALDGWFEACDRLDAQQQEIEKLKEGQKYLEECLADKRRLTKEISDILHPDGNGPKEPSLCDVVKYLRDHFLKSQAERIEKLETAHREEIYRLNDKCVAMRKALTERIERLEKYLRLFIDREVELHSQPDQPYSVDDVLVSEAEQALTEEIEKLKEA